MGSGDIISRICGDMEEDGDVLRFLAETLSPADLQSLLLEAFARRASRLTPRDILGAYRANRFAAPSIADPARLCLIDSAAYALLTPAFTAVEPSPLAPFGAASALGPVSQNKIVTALRGTEVCSDVTNVLALECAVRRRELLKKDTHSLDRVKLCASQRQVRSQPFTGPNSFTHFQVFALCTAGHDEGNHRFERDAAEEQISFYLNLLHSLAEKGFQIRETELELVVFDRDYGDLAVSLHAEFEERTRQPVAVVERLDQRYYGGIGFHVFATNGQGEKLFLADGGFTDWTQKLLGNRKERLLTSGIGTERLALRFY